MFINYYKQVSKQKCLELEFHRFEEWSYFDLSIKLNRKTDHAGLNLSIELFGFFFCIAIYDTRHWDYDKNKWHEYNA